VQYVPKAVLGAVIVFAAIGLVEPQAWRALTAVDYVEVAIAGVTTGCVVVFGVLEALGVAVGLSVIDTVRRSARPTTRCSAGSRGSGATPMSRSTGRRG
jgi:sulfate permease, SulP family